MRLIKTPQRSDVAIDYAADGDALLVRIDGVEDSFDFTGAGEGTFTDFSSGTLPFCPVLSATKDADGLTIKVINAYGPEPQQSEGETDEDYAPRHAEWDRQRSEYEVEI